MHGYLGNDKGLCRKKESEVGLDDIHLGTEFTEIDFRYRISGIAFTLRYPATSGTAFPETTKTDSETAVERGLLLLIDGVLLSLAKPYIPYLAL
jgi:hypothetical protein